MSILLENYKKLTECVEQVEQIESTFRGEEEGEQTDTITT
jgi:hypothetical protein